jgi:hypothetical protein
MLRRTQDEYIIHLLSVQLSHGHFAYRWIDDGTLAGEAATDEGSNPLDDIVMPGKVRGLFSFFTRIYSKRLKKRCVTHLSFSPGCTHYSSDSMIACTTRTLEGLLLRPIPLFVLDHRFCSRVPEATLR